MIDIIFILSWGFMLLIPERLLRLPLLDIPVEFNFTTLLIIYVGFTSTFFKGLISIVILSFILETLSFIPHGYLITTNSILFIMLTLIVDQIMTEAYVTKAFWVFIFSMVSQLLNRLVFFSPELVLDQGFFWLLSLFNSMICAIISIPLFMIFDLTFEQFKPLFSSRQAHVTGADLYQVKSKQRKYLQ